jgi:hypothetical protein
VQNHTLPLTGHHHPATFRSRGVAVPFTTPMLAGARVRQSDNAGIELVVSNPSGGRGVYILGWLGVRALCSPTVHDTRLFQRFRHLAAVDPSRIRRAARAVAAEGYAGRTAVSAAATAMANDRSERLLAHLRLLTRLADQHAPDGPRPADLAERTPDLDRRASVTLHQLAPSLGRPAARLAIDIMAIADAFAPLGTAPPGIGAPKGISRNDQNGRIPRLIGRTDATSSALFSWLDTDVDNDIGDLGRAVAEAMRTATRTAEAVLEVVRAALSDPAALLQRWVRDAAGVRASASRCDWLLDGWERVCLLWAIATSDASRRAALLEMAPLVPVLPREVEEWTDVAIPREAMNELCHVTNSRDAWRSGGAALGWIQRNEQLRAMST